MSLALIEALAVPRDAGVIDIGGGASQLVDRLAGQGFTDLTVLDVSASALEELRRRLGDSPVIRLHEDLLFGSQIAGTTSGTTARCSTSL